ncbi:secreted antigen 1, partial [Babesia divergens]
KDVMARKFKGKLSDAKAEDLSKICVHVSSTLESVTRSLIPRYGPGSVAERKEIPKNFYEDVLKPWDFDVYAIWLEKNIQNITESYKKMLEESVKLTATELKTETSVGPLKYGFVYNGYWWGEIVYWLPPDVYADTGFLEALNELKTSLDKIPKSPVETSTVDYQINEDDVEEPFSADVSDIAENLKESTVESSPESSPVPKSNLVFESSEWDDSHLASSVLFLEEFCRDVNTKKFKGKLSGKALKDLFKICVHVSSTLESVTRSLIPRYGPGSVAGRKEIPRDLYKGILKPEKFDVYAKWLKDNIPGIIESLISMFNESIKLPEEQVNTETSVGPLKYGFVYKSNWWWWKWFAYVNYTLRSYTKGLIQHFLPGILKCL